MTESEANMLYDIAKAAVAVVDDLDHALSANEIALAAAVDAWTHAYPKAKG